MSEIFRLKIVSKRQVTLPQLMLEALHLREGDELEVQVEDGEVVAVRPLKLVPATFFTKRMLKVLENRSKSMEAGDTARAGRPEETGMSKAPATAKSRSFAAMETAERATARETAESSSS